MQHFMTSTGAFRSTWRGSSRPSLVNAMLTCIKSAGTRLAGVAELVEAILLDLPLVDILCAQRVDRAWHGFIKNSPKLQRALFLLPCADYTLTLIATKNGALECTDAVTCDTGRIRSVFFSRYCYPSSKKTLGEITRNPFPASKLLWLSRSFMIYRGTEIGRPTSEASWRKMLFSQPPVDAVIVHHGEAKHFHMVRAKPGSNGVTLGDLQESADAFYGSVEADVSEWDFYDIEHATTSHLCTASHVLRVIRPRADKKEIEE